MKAPKCSGTVKPPEMSAECKSKCDAKVSAQLECTPPSVEVVVTGAADAKVAAQLKTALTKSLPALLTITVGMKGTVERATASVQASLESLQSAVTADANVALKAGGCIAAALEAQVQASASINVSMKASASASAKASTG
jgi:hypothetical protein